ncbi:MAG: TraR/DksA C4-type zinc finger protein [Mycobacteriales bacterium]
MTGRPPADVDPAAVSAALHSDRAETLSEIEELTGDFDGMVAASASSNADDEHDPEGSTIAFERAQIVAVLELAQRRLADVDGALQRLDAGTYGVCVRCGAGINEERLAARPSVATCINCAKTG